MKSIKLKKLTWVVFVLLCFPVYAQIESQQLRWYVSGFRNTDTNDRVSVESRFETGPNSIKWYQNKGAYVYEFSIIDVEGSWADIKEAGEINYKVSFRNASGKIRFRKDQNEITIEIDIKDSGKNLLPYLLTVNKVEVQ